MDLLTRFLKYVSIPTTSNSASNTTPSTQEQRVLASYLLEELKNLGVDSIDYDEEHCYIYACLNKNIETDSKIGFIAHMDTSEQANGDNIKPNIIENYDGDDIILEQDRINVIDNPDLKNHVGKTIITTDGTTLLGGDDKAGIAEIMTMLEYFKNTNEPHGDIYVAFTPDEEIGKGTTYFDLNKFKADFAYTVDGEYLGEISYENFNAADITIEINGVYIHPGYAKNKMVNSLLLANAIIDALPNETPANTEGKEGFFHLMKLSGEAHHTTMKYIIRDHDKVKFENRKQLLIFIIDQLNKKYNNRISLSIRDRYYNMYEIIQKNMDVVDIPIKSIEKLGITPIIKPIRGGTDGANLTFKGLPCPNIGTGSHNFHSTTEYAVLEDMEKVSEILINIVKDYSLNNIKCNQKQKIKEINSDYRS